MNLQTSTHTQEGCEHDGCPTENRKTGGISCIDITAMHERDIYLQRTGPSDAFRYAIPTYPCNDKGVSVQQTLSSYTQLSQSSRSLDPK